MTTDVESEVVEQLTVREPGDDVLVRNAARKLAEDAGFDEAAAEEVALSGSELAANVLDHADDGEIELSRIAAGDRDGVRIESFDAGPGIDDVDAAFADGVSSTGSLGGGLGAVNRLMDQVTVAAPGEPAYGTHVVADRWLRPPHESTERCPLSFGAASRPKTAGTANGDSFVIKRWDDSALVGVIDGLGHGQPAHKAAIAAKGYVERHCDRPMTSIFEGAGRACRGTRGVVMALVRFDWSEGTATVGSVGNINYKADVSSDFSIVPRRGVVGNDGPGPVVRSAAWVPTDRLVLFSDGVGSRWELADYDHVFDGSTPAAARKLLASLGKDDDDATVLVVSAAPSNAV